MTPASSFRSESDETAGGLFQTLTRESTLSARVTAQLEQMMAKGRLKPGDSLPAERDLAGRFGVSRTVVREAVRSLAARGLLEVSAGSGTVVSRPRAESVAHSMALFIMTGQGRVEYPKILEVRRLIEVETAGLAALRRTEADLTALEKALADLLREPLDRRGFAESDVAFHQALAEATQNALFPLLLGSLREILMLSRELAFELPGTPERAFSFHQSILEEVRRGNVPGARQAMEAHMAEAEETMMRLHEEGGL